MLFVKGVILLPSVILSVSQAVFEDVPSVVLLQRCEMLALAANGDPGGGVGKLRAPSVEQSAIGPRSRGSFRSVPTRGSVVFSLVTLMPRCSGLLFLVAGTVVTFAICHVVGAPPLQSLSPARDW